MRDTILVVDSLDKERAELVKILQNEGKIIEASDGEEALELIEKNIDELEAILLKLMIPKVDGIHLLETIRKKGWAQRVPVLIIGKPGPAVMENKCFELGALDFIQNPFTEETVVRHVQTAVRSFFGSEVQQNKQEQQDKQGQLDAQKQQNMLMKQQYRILHKQAEELSSLRKNIIEVLGTIAEYRNMDRRSHIKNVEAITKILADEMMRTFPECGLTDKKISLIVSSSALHDIGKIAVPDSVLMKPGKMTEKEHELMKSHTTKGCEILEQMQGIWDQEYADICGEICRSHHERYDGKGYPDGLSGDSIPISAQLVSIADVYDALVNDRVYRKAYSKEQAYNMIISGECGIFNPRLMDCFAKNRETIEELYSALDVQTTKTAEN